MKSGEHVQNNFAYPLVWHGGFLHRALGRWFSGSRGNLTAETQRTAEFAEKSTAVSAVGLVAIRAGLGWQRRRLKTARPKTQERKTLNLAGKPGSETGAPNATKIQENQRNRRILTADYADDADVLRKEITLPSVLSASSAVKKTKKSEVAV